MNAIQLYSHKFSQTSYDIILNSKALDTLQANFDPHTPITVLCTAGTVGTGKSTQLNIIAHLLDKSIDYNIFQTSSGINTCTSGIWIYPKPLYSCDKNYQILLCDMEGQGGIGENNFELFQQMLQKLYLLGFMICSTYSIHCNLRPTVEDIKLLDKIHSIIQMNKQKFQINVPKLYLFIKGQQSISDKQKNSFIQIAQQANIGLDVLNLLKFMPGKNLSEDFREENDFKYLHQNYNTQYIEQCKSFITEFQRSPSNIPGIHQSANISYIVSVFQQTKDLINNDNFMQIYNIYFQIQLEEIFSPIYQELSQQYKKQSEDLANTVKNNFENKLEQLKASFISQFDGKITDLAKQNKFSKVKYEFYKQQLMNDFQKSQAEIIYLKKKSQLEHQQQKEWFLQKIRKIQRDQENVIEIQQQQIKKHLYYYKRQLDILSNSKSFSKKKYENKLQKLGKAMDSYNDLKENVDNNFQKLQKKVVSGKLKESDYENQVKLSQKLSQFRIDDSLLQDDSDDDTEAYNTTNQEKLLPADFCSKGHILNLKSKYQSFQSKYKCKGCEQFIKNLNINAYVCDTCSYSRCLNCYIQVIDVDPTDQCLNCHSLQKKQFYQLTDYSVQCNNCFQKLSDSRQTFYTCSQCQFYRCDKCHSQNVDIQHCIDGHNLVYLHKNNSRIQYIQCDMCLQNLSDNPCGTYRCERCDFDRCERCYNSKFSKSQLTDCCPKNHPLIQISKNNQNRVDKYCGNCYKSTKNQHIYFCQKCNYYKCQNCYCEATGQRMQGNSNDSSEDLLAEKLECKQQ